MDAERDAEVRAMESIELQDIVDEKKIDLSPTVENSFPSNDNVVVQVTENIQSPTKLKPRYDKAFKVKVIKLTIMMFLALIVFGSEISVGIIAGSLALISDAFHMFSDFFGLIIGAVALGLSRKPKSKKMSYGWARMEILGGLISGVFLVAIAFFIIVDAIQRYIEPHMITRAWFVLGTGLFTMAVNLFGMILFCGHVPHLGHDHGHDKKENTKHAHDHGNKKKKKNDKFHEDVVTEVQVTITDVTENPTPKKEEEDGDHSKHSHKHAHDHNMLGIFIHITGDFLGSVGVIISAIFLLVFPNHSWTVYIDPSVSVILAIVILTSAVPLVITSSKVLVQGVPKGINVSDITSQILALDGVVGVHELHVWQLINSRYISSLHLRCDKDEFMNIAQNVQSIMHKHNVHSTTVQPEFISEEEIEQHACKLRCDVDCEENWCCPPENEPLLTK